MRYTDVLRWGILASIFLVPFIPFIVAQGGAFPDMFFPYITGKNFAFRILVEVMLLCYVILALKDPKYRPQSSMLLWTGLAFVAWMAVATAFSVDPVKSFWSNFERMEGYIALLHLFVWFVVTGVVLTADNLWERFINTSIGVAVLQGCMALFQVIHLFGFSPTSQSGARADTTFGNATYLAVYLLVMFFLTLFMLVRRRKSTMWQVWYGIALVVEFIGLYFTETRGAILGLIGGLVIAAVWIAWRARGEEWRTLRRVSISALIVIVVLGVAFVALRNTSLVRSNNTLNRLASISLQDGTTQARFLIWGMAWRGFSESPKTVLAGWGQENFSYVFNKYYNPAMYGQEQWFDRAHNQFIDWFINGGLPAGLLYIALYALALWALVRTHKLSVPEQGIFLGLFAGFAFNNLFVFDNLLSAIYFWALLAFVHSLVRRELPSTILLTKPAGDHAVAIAAPIVGVVVLACGWWFNVPAIARGEQLIVALQNTDPAQSVAVFSKALTPDVWPTNPLGVQETTEQLAQYASQIGSSSASPDIKNQVAATALSSLNALMAQRKHDARLDLFLGTFLSGVGQMSQAIDALKQALADSPHKQQILIQLGLAEIQSGDSTSGLAHLKQAFDLAPDYDAARIFYAAGYYYAGQQSQGDKILTEKFGSPIVDDDQLLRVYTNLKQYNRAEAIWQLRINNDPKNTQYHLGLAQVYFVAGDNPDTIAELKKIIALDPSQASKVQPIITAIQNGSLKPGQ